MTTREVSGPHAPGSEQEEGEGQQPRQTCSLPNGGWGLEPPPPAGSLPRNRLPALHATSPKPEVGKDG